MDELLPHHLVTNISIGNSPSRLGPLRALATTDGKGDLSEKQPVPSNGDSHDTTNQNHYFKSAQWYDPVFLEVG